MELPTQIQICRAARTAGSPRVACTAGPSRAARSAAHFTATEAGAQPLRPSSLGQLHISNTLPPSRNQAGRRGSPSAGPRKVVPPDGQPAKEPLPLCYGRSRRSGKSPAITAVDGATARPHRGEDASLLLCRGRSRSAKCNPAVMTAVLRAIVRLRGGEGTGSLCSRGSI